jgi:hypothetical protein
MQKHYSCHTRTAPKSNPLGHSYTLLVVVLGLHIPIHSIYNDKITMLLFSEQFPILLSTKSWRHF